MSKIQSERERKLQKRLIPLNIFVCILCIVSIFSLIFAPILKVDIGKILHDEGMKTFVDEEIDKMVGGSLGEAEQSGVNFAPVIASIVSNVLDSAEGSITISAYSASKVAGSSISAVQALIKGEPVKDSEAADIVLNELFYGENALVTKLIDSVVDGIGNLIKPEDGKSTPLYDVMEEAIISTLTTQIVENFGNEHLTEESVKALTDAFKGIESVEDGDVSGVVDNIAAEVKNITGSDISEEEKEKINKEVQKLYDETAAELDEGENVTIESLVCVAVSKNLDLSGFNIDSLLGGMLGGNGEDPKPEEGAFLKRAVADGITDGADEGDESEIPDGSDEGGESEIPDGSDEGGESEIPDGSDEGGETEKPETPENPGTEDSDRKIVTSYADLMTEIGFDNTKLEELKTNLKTSLRTQVDSAIAENTGYLALYGLIFYLILAFAIPWIILFLFSFLHMLAKNKRFMMWYVKLFCFIPAIISLALALAPKLVPIIPGLSDMINGEGGPVVKAALSGISSLMWISGLCYLLLWLVSICWAFPIKHQIRKERKAVAKYGITDNYDSGTSYGGTSQDSYGYGSILDDDDGFNSPYEGSAFDFGSGYDSGYGSLFDDDDDDLF